MRNSLFVWGSNISRWKDAQELNTRLKGRKRHKKLSWAATNLGWRVAQSPQVHQAASISKPAKPHAVTTAPPPKGGKPKHSQASSRRRSRAGAPAMSAAGKAKAKAGGGKRGAPAKDPADAPLLSDKRRRERGGMDDSDHEFDRCLACLLPLPLPTPLAFANWPRCFGFGAVPARDPSNRGDEARVSWVCAPVRHELCSVSVDPFLVEFRVINWFLYTRFMVWDMLQCDWWRQWHEGDRHTSAAHQGQGPQGRSEEDWAGYLQVISISIPRTHPTFWFCWIYVRYCSVMCVMYVCALIEGDLVRGNQQIYFDLLNLHSMTDILGIRLVEGMW